MKLDIILAGVGGQGILSIAAIIGTAALKNGYYLKQAEVHGMSQRGGDVQSHLRISDKPIHSDLIPMGECDMILSVEPMESLRYLPYLSNKGWVVTNSKPFINIPNYPELNSVLAEIKKLKNNICINADDIAKEMGAARSMNMVMLGAAAAFMDIKVEDLQDAIKEIFERKGEKIVEMNLNAFNKGLEFSKANK
ncbi:MAG TPA: indolepyruvate oxidoreductase subunit beta [Candidatus Cloacimonadota bacterium]|nr:indolepyruvate oxidoreductase subunit beta [Candidatus Cloacimonadales bacterium]HPY96260.1 indolepyruvate oxidoreductase subunit beta [Candidatus Cloacimonadota bacterium]HQB40849.1 indolepyruvate oxidoreductase subunit beta [Candidatus Cloacimonadota bacterium]